MSEPCPFIHSATAFGPFVAPLPDAAAPIFPYWSFTKTALATLALMLVEDGRLSLDAPVAGQEYSLRQILNHSAGLPDYFTLPTYRRAVEADETPWPPDQLLRAALAQDRLFTPGQGWSYSNVGYVLARRMIEAATGQPLAELIATRIASPLGLRSVMLAETREDFARVLWQGARRYHPAWVYHGCLIGTAQDAAGLLHGLMAGRLIGAAMLAEMLVALPVGGALPGRPWSECGYGLGLMIGRCGAAGRAIGHTGGGPFSSNAVYHFPDRADPPTIATFAEGPDGRPAEFAATDAALTHPPLSA